MSDKEMLSMMEMFESISNDNERMVPAINSSATSASSTVDLLNDLLGADEDAPRLPSPQTSPSEIMTKTRTFLELLDIPQKIALDSAIGLKVKILGRNFQQELLNISIINPSGEESIHKLNVQDNIISIEFEPLDVGEFIIYVSYDQVLARGCPRTVEIELLNYSCLMSPTRFNNMELSRTHIQHAHNHLDDNRDIVSLDITCFGSRCKNIVHLLYWKKDKYLIPKFMKSQYFCQLCSLTNKSAGSCPTTDDSNNGESDPSPQSSFEENKKDAESSNQDNLQLEREPLRDVTHLY